MQDGSAAAGSLRGTERERLAGLDGDAPEVDPADRLDGRLHDVVRPDGDPARHDQGVGAGRQTASQSFQDIIEVVGGDPEIQASPPDAVTRARRPGPLASGIPAGPSGSPGARISSPVASTATRGRLWTRSSSTPAPVMSATAAAVIAMPGLSRLAPAARSPPRRANRTAGCDRFVDQDRRRHRPGRVPTARAGRPGSVEWRRRLDRNDGVGAVGEPGAGRDPGCGALSDRDIRRGASGDVADDPELDRGGLGRVGGVGGLDRIAVHRRIRPRWERDARDNSLGRDAAEGVSGSH